MVSPYDFNEAVGHRADYVEERLRDGSPVVGLRYKDGVLLLSLKRTQRKVYEVYDRLMMSAMGNQADVEAIRIGALDFAHQEGFARSPDDVTVNRLVGFALSPALKKAFGDTWSAPLAFRGVFAELSMNPAQDRFAMLNYDGEFSYSTDYGVAAGTHFAEETMIEHLQEASRDLPLEDALRLALDAWTLGHRHSARGASAKRDNRDDEEETQEPKTDPAEYLKEQLKTLSVEAAVLDRTRPTETKFRLLRDDELQPLLPA